MEKDTYEKDAKTEPGTEPWMKRFHVLVLGCLLLNTALLLAGYLLIRHSLEYQFLDELDALKQQYASQAGESAQPETVESTAEPHQSETVDSTGEPLRPEPADPAARIETATPSESAARPEEFLDWLREGIPGDVMMNNSFIKAELTDSSFLNNVAGDGKAASDSHELGLRFSRMAMQSITQQEGIFYIQIRIPDDVSGGVWNGTMSMEGKDTNSDCFGAAGIYKNNSVVTKVQSIGSKAETEFSIEYKGGDYIGIKFDIALSGGEFQCFLTQR